VDDNTIKNICEEAVRAGEVPGIFAEHPEERVCELRDRPIPRRQGASWCVQRFRSVCDCGDGHGLSLQS
jgi:hypothetical protein